MSIVTLLIHALIKVGKQNSCELTHCLESRCPTSSFPILRDIRDWNANVCRAYLRWCCNNLRLQLSGLGKQKRLGWLSSILLCCYPTPHPQMGHRGMLSRGSLPWDRYRDSLPAWQLPFKQTVSQTLPCVTPASLTHCRVSLCLPASHKLPDIAAINNFTLTMMRGRSADVFSHLILMF